MFPMRLFSDWALRYRLQLFPKAALRVSPAGITAPAAAQSSRNERRCFSEMDYLGINRLDASLIARQPDHHNRADGHRSRKRHEVTEQG